MKNNHILLAHGSGGRLMHELIENVFRRGFDNEILNELSDAAVLNFKDTILCFTTDSYVVKPLFFPGGDIGKLAICGTINDLAVMGSRAVYISCGFIIEEGLSFKILEKVVESMRRIAQQQRVKIVTGDIKVVEKGKADKLFINTSAIGVRLKSISLGREYIRPGDRIIINGSLGDHGMSILAARGDFSFDVELESDCNALIDLVEKALAGASIKFMRDPTRGGLATTLNEIVKDMDFGILIEESSLPIKKEVKAISEILGLDPLYIPNEGKVLIIVAEKDTERLLSTLKSHPLGKDSSLIGEVISSPKQRVLLHTSIKGTRIVEMLTGEQFPRIC